MSLTESALAAFTERLGAALPQAISDAFGGSAPLTSLTPGDVPSLLADFGPGYHVHLEIEASGGRQEARQVVLVLRLDDGARLFGLEPVDPALLGDPETQLRALAEFTEGGEALAASLAAVLAGMGTPLTLRVSGASLETDNASPTAALVPLGESDVNACRLVMQRAPEESLSVVVVAPVELAVMTGDSVMEAPRPAPRSAPPTPPTAAPAATPGDPVAAPLAPIPGEPPVTAHPFNFGQLGAPTAAPRPERNIDPILDVSLQVRVELGSTHMTVEEVLALSPGSIVELDRLAGEPVDIVVNNRLIARGEVVVVEENFGVRVTEIIAQRARAAG
jgi:flagellar motor switch protein FliN/FliY